MTQYLNNANSSAGTFTPTDHHCWHYFSLPKINQVSQWWILYNDSKRKKTNRTSSGRHLELHLALKTCPSTRTVPPPMIIQASSSCFSFKSTFERDFCSQQGLTADLTAQIWLWHVESLSWGSSSEQPCLVCGPTSIKNQLNYDGEEGWAGRTECARLNQRRFDLAENTARCHVSVSHGNALCECCGLTERRVCRGSPTDTV